MVKLSKEQQIQENEYDFPYHYLNLLSPFQDVEYTSYIKIVKHLVSPLGGKSLFDFGCGDGRFEYELKDSGAKIVGLDHSMKALSFAKAFNREATFYDKEIMQFNPKQKFDYIVTIEVLEHIPPRELPKILSKLSNLLKPQGKIIVTVPSKNIPISSKHFQHFNEEVLRRYLEPYFKIEKIIGHHRTGPLSFFFRLINAFGRILEIISKGVASVYSRFLWNFYRHNIEICSPKNARRLIAVCSRK